MRAVALLFAAVIAAGCGDNVRGSVTIIAPEPFAAALTEFADQMPTRGVRVGTASDVGNGVRVTVVQETTLPAEGYRLEASGDALTVYAPDLLGAQYGAAAALEAMGYRFRHPHAIYTPPELSVPASIDGRVHQPEIRVRGFQYHTLHPIETYYAFWEPSPRSLFEAKRMIDWTVKNKGNYIQWVALDDITDATKHAAWKPFTQEILAYAHARGVRVGLNIQMFGQANLQQAFDLVDDDTGTVPIPDQMAERLPLITQDLPFDVYDVSFGEFFSADPQQFIDALNELHDQLKILAPHAELHAFIHVGGEQVVEYQGETLLYYFLVKFANPEIIHDVHSVMFYNLFETASGAYHSDNFFVHRDYLLDQICTDRRPAYVPETSYWVAFDNSVPLYLPIYIYNRWLDLDRIKSATASTPGCEGKALDSHVIFTTGWEWGYWMHDTATLRATYELPADVGTLITEEAGEDLAPVAPLILELAELQREFLHLGGLQAYMQGRDAAIDLGDMIDIVSQPDRTTFADLEAGADPGVFETTVLTPVTVYVAALESLHQRFQAAGLADSRWSREILDGVTVDLQRAHFVHGVYTAALAYLGGNAAAAETARLEAANALAVGTATVAARHGDLHDPYGRRLLDPGPNATFYQYGYLHMSDTLCFWRRELIQLETLMGLGNEEVPNCLL